VQPRLIASHNMELAPRKASRCARVEELANVADLKGEELANVAELKSWRAHRIHVRAFQKCMRGCEVNSSVARRPKSMAHRRAQAPKSRAVY
jgi:hypothetical protein